jgi:putative inorganic carbon (hco3(-)) transporter
MDLQQRLARVAFWCALSSAATTVVSIAASQSLLGISLAAIILARLEWRVPPHWKAIAIFMALTLLSVALSDAPKAGWPQVKKFYVWLILIAVASTFRRLEDARLLAVAWVALATASSLRGLWQFWTSLAKARAEGVDFYTAYVAQRITGFMSHWMTFSGEMMLALLVGVALLFWGGLSKRMKWAAGACLLVIATALLLAFTRGMWIAAAVGGLYLLWNWRKWTVLLLPAAALLVLAAGPTGVRDRAVSLVRPHGEKDSNRHRIVTFRTGLRMIAAHPWFGLGPERVGPHFQEYVPAELTPLPEGYYGHLHNIYVHYAAERGVPAMLALVWFLLATLKDWVSALRRAAGQREWLLRAGVAALIGVMTAGLFEYNLGDSEVLAMTLALIAATGACLSSPPAEAR